MVLDCADPRTLAQFWASALGYEVGSWEPPYLVLRPNETGPIELVLQRVPEPKRVKNRMHLDIHVPDIDREADRLIALGARRLKPEVIEENDFRWYLMADPEGNEFCVISEPKS